MNKPANPFKPYSRKAPTVDGVYSNSEVALANRNHGSLLETLELDITPTGAHYLLSHFDVPLLDENKHVLKFSGAFQNPYELTMDEIRALPQKSEPVTMECAGNGRAGMSPRSHSMPWMYEAVGTSLWTGTPLAPLISRAAPQHGTVEVSFTGADFGYDMGEGHYFGRSLTLAQLDELEVLLVHAMNGAPLLPQHGAPLRIVVPGWYGMASVKWLCEIRALTSPYDGFQQMRTYRFKQSADEIGEPVQDIFVKSLMKPPGVPDWGSRMRHLEAGPVVLSGRAWSGAGRAVSSVEVCIGDTWHEAELQTAAGKYAWSKWWLNWNAQPGEYVLQCRATDEAGNTQPLQAQWNYSGFANNAVQQVHVFVD